MIKSDNWLLEYGMAVFEPFNSAQVNPASYDLRLDNRYIDLHIGKSIVADQIILQPPKYNYNKTILFTYFLMAMFHNLEAKKKIHLNQNDLKMGMIMAFSRMEYE